MIETVENIVKAAVADVVRQQQRQEELDALYEKDGRADRSHPMYGLYTGLMQQSQDSGGVTV